MKYRFGTNPAYKARHSLLLPNNHSITEIMKPKNYQKLISTSFLSLLSGVAFAGAEEMKKEAPAADASSDVISGILKLDFNSHFISYGADVWGDGSTMSESTFNPNLELYFKLPADLTFTLGTWWDVNTNKGDNATTSSIGGRIQEVDVYGGLSYTIDKFTVGATYQAWMYGGDTEDILDIKFAYDCLLAPSLTVHNRLDQGAAGGDEGTILVLGLSHSIEAGPVTFSIPFNLAYFLEDDFHGGTDTGFGYASIGVAAALPLTPYMGDAYGEWTLNSGLTYYLTDNDIIPGNKQENFLTASLGLAVAF